MSRKGYWSLAAIALILLLTGQWWINRSNDQPLAPSALRDQPIDYALSNFSAEFFNSDGQLELVVEAPSLEHQAETRRAYITEPTFILSAQQPAWHGRAQTGIIDRNLQQLELDGEVIMRQAHEDGEIQVKSDHIRYDRSLQELHSPAAATISQAGTELHGGTLTVWLDEQRAELKHDVQGTFRTIAGGTADQPGGGADQRN